jgi:protein-disulfide isomerase
MKTANKKEAVAQEQPQASKKEQPSERTENIVALVIFAFLILIGVGIFTQGFGLFNKDLNPGQRVKVPTGDDPYIGNSNASVTIYVFSDYECPNCKIGEERMKAILAKYGDKILYFFKNHPLTSIHPDAYNASLAAECANEQGKFWEYHDYLFAHNTQLGTSYLEQYASELGFDTERFNICFETQRYKEKVDADLKSGAEIGVPGTPTFIINGLVVVGAKSEQEFYDIIDKELK